MTANYTRTLPADLVDGIVANSGRVPREREDEFRTTLSRWADTDLDGGAGFFVLADLSALDEDAARTFTLAASEALGRPMPQTFDSEFIREVKDRGRTLERDSTARYSDTRFGGNMHTDGMHREGYVPDYFTLFCVRQAQQGGELLIVDVADVLVRLKGRPDILSTLRGDFFFDTRASDPALPQAIRRPVLEDYRDGTRIHYFREYIESGQKRCGGGDLTIAQREALDYMDALLADPALQKSVRAGAGQMLFINNSRLVHGRTDFVDAPGPGQGRLLFRTWIDASERLDAK
jgi:hypothetical protein